MIKTLFNIKSFLKILISSICILIISSLFIDFINKLDVNVEDIPIAIVDLDKSKKSEELCKNLSYKTNLIVEKNENCAIDKLANSKTQLVVIVNDGYEEKITKARLTNLFTVYTGYNEKYSRLLLEIISEEVLKEWVSYKLSKENKDISYEIDFTSLDNFNVSESINIREISIDGDQINIIDTEDISLKTNIYIFVMFVLSSFIFISQGYKAIKEKINGILKRVFMFHNKGKMLYVVRILIELSQVFFVNLFIFGIVLVTLGINFSFICKIFLSYLFYLIIIKIIISIILYLSNSISIFSLLVFIFTVINCSLLSLMIFVKGLINI